MTLSLKVFLMIPKDFLVPSINVLFSSTIMTGARKRMNPRIKPNIDKKTTNNVITGSGINIELNIARAETREMRKSRKENRN